MIAHPEESDELTPEYVYQAALEEILGNGEISREEETVLQSLRDFLEIQPDVYQRLFETTRRRIQDMETLPLQRDFAPEPFLFKIFRRTIQDGTVTAGEKDIIQKVCRALMIDRETVERVFTRAKAAYAEEVARQRDENQVSEPTVPADVQPEPAPNPGLSGTIAQATPVPEESATRIPPGDSGKTAARRPQPAPAPPQPRPGFPPTPVSPTGKAPSSKKLGRRELVAELGEASLVTLVELYVKNSIDPQPKTKVQFMQGLMSEGMRSEIAMAVMDYAENSEEGKDIALGTSWETLWYGLAAVVFGILLNVFTVVATGYIVKGLVAIPILGFLALVNSGQKILLVNYPIFKGPLGQALLFLCFLGFMGGLGYYILR